VADFSRFKRAMVKDFFKAPDCAAYEDYRDLLQNPQVDAIICNYEDFWHAPVILDALAAGKHVLVNPPLCRYLPEALAIWDACRKSGKVLQVGVAACADRRWHTAAELIRAGALGPVVMAQGSYMRNSPKGEWNCALLPWGNSEDVDWKRWTRQVAGAPENYSTEEWFRWQKYYRYSGGLLAKLLPQKIHPYLIALGNPGFPVRVAALGNNKFNTDAGTPNAGRRDVPEFIQVIAEMPGGAILRLAAGSVNEQGLPEAIHGQHASLLMQSSSMVLVPEAAFASETQHQTFGPFAPESATQFLAHWLASLRGQEKLLCDIELAVRAQVFLCLAEMSDRLSTVCLFDEQTRTVTDGSGREIKASVLYGKL
jgi:predicted dehydrogenase